MEVDLLQQPIPLILLSLGHVCSFGSSTTVWPITQLLGQALTNTKNRFERFTNLNTPALPGVFDYPLNQYFKSSK
jgi:hypothetical protein